MEIKFKQGDRLPIPEGCKAVIRGDIVLIEKKETEFKDGDIVSVKDVWGDTDIFILKYRDAKGLNHYYIALSSSGNLVQNSNDEEYWGDTTPVLATEEEKQLLFDKMKEQGLRWNTKEKRVENIRWRALPNETYYFVTTTGVADDGKEYPFWHTTPENRHRIFNYFRTKEQAEKAAEVVKEALRKFHEENE